MNKLIGIIVTGTSLIKLCYLLLLSILLYGCGGGDGSSNDDSNNGSSINSVVFSEPWPENISSVYSVNYTEEAHDHQVAPGGAPDYENPVDYPPVDLIALSMGTDELFFYIRFDFASDIPTEKDPIPSDGAIEAQQVLSQSISINFNSDGDLSTGAGGEGIDGIDIFFAFSYKYGTPPYVYANYGFPDGDIHNHLGQADGEMGEGGPGYSFVILRFLLSDVADYLPQDQTLDYGGWSEAESDLYHHFSFDPFEPGQMHIE
ncbi:MAG: hypothetical protein JAY97_03555 [Candidatus Thiodiazotropha sp. 'RUGA']|nr:hypothetical protein [Candidatus Thiodiazotropha sp. 'RUGA']